MGESSLAHYTKAKHTRAADVMLGGGLILPRQFMFVPRTKCERWLCATKANHVCSADKLLEIGFVAPNQFVPRTECLKLGLPTKPSQVADDGM